MALQRERIANLFKQAEESAQRAVEQSRQLKETNALMEEQQQQLQQQTEELQQTNAQMEEQRQQVEQQSAELRRNNEALRRSQEEVNARASQLEEANRYKTDFLANMSHELRTPLNAIILISKMMAKNEEGKLDEESVKRTQVVLSAGNDLLRLITDILDLSKIEAGQIELYRESFPTAELAEEMKALFEESSREKKIAYLVEDQYHDEITSDRHKIVQVLRNLISNAFKFTREGEVALRFQPSGDAKRPLRIIVSDTGIGIPESKIDQIFEEFRQVDSSISREYGGTGLGLSITKKFIQLLDGVIEVRSREGVGSEFIVLLPERLDSLKVVPIVQDSHNEISEPATDDDSPLPERDEKAILVIDDDPHFLENITFINRYKGLKTLTALTGEEGVALARFHRPTGVILDLGLPDMRGEEVLERLKTDRDLRRIPVYIVSARDKDQTLMEQGAIGFLQKPVTDSQIEMAEALLLRTVKQGRNALLVIEGPALKRGLIEDNIRKTDCCLIVTDSATEGLELLSRETFDLILTDHDLVDMDCAEFCEKLRDRQPKAPIIIYSSNKLDEERFTQLRSFTDSIIQQAPQAELRISRNIIRFLTAVTTGKNGQASTPQPDVNKTGTLSGRCILVVDDDPRNLFVLTASLEHNGAREIQAINGLKALYAGNDETQIVVYHTCLAHYLHQLGLSCHHKSIVRKPVCEEEIKALALGGSADSLAKIIHIIECLPKSDITVFVVQHVPENKPHRLDQLLRTRTDYALLMPFHMTPVRPGTIYIAPPGHHMRIHSGYVYLTCDRKQDYAQPSISVLFDSLAREYGAHLVVALLCGYGRDGVDAMGLVRQMKGLALVERSDECEAAALVENALAEEKFDMILSWREIASFFASAARPQPPVDDELITISLEALEVRYGYAFQSYAQGTLRRRIAKLMAETGHHSFYTFQKELLSRPFSFEHLLMELSIGITEFFRHPEQLACLRKHVLPYLENFHHIRIWVAGCASGEMAYSLAIMLEEASLLNKSQIYATDINSSFLQQAHNGLYSIQALEKARNNYALSGGTVTFDDYVENHGFFMAIAPRFQKKILFYHHSLVNGGVFNEFQLILCTNVMIYFNEALQGEVIELLSRSLHKDGFLMLGRNEGISTGRGERFFQEEDGGMKIYRWKQGG